MEKAKLKKMLTTRIRPVLDLTRVDLSSSAGQLVLDILSGREGHKFINVRWPEEQLPKLMSEIFIENVVRIDTIAHENALNYTKKGNDKALILETPGV